MDTQYFAHDYDARRDIKMIRLRNEMGYEGIGIYWSLIEFLYENDNKCLVDDMAAVADELHTDEEKLRRVVEDFDLFAIEEGSFFSESIARRLGRRKEVSNKRSSAAARRRDRRGEESADPQAIDGVAEIVEKTDKEDETVCKTFATTLQGKIKKKKKKIIIPPYPPRGRNRANRFQVSILKPRPRPNGLPKTWPTRSTTGFSTSADGAAPTPTPCPPDGATTA